MSLMALRANLKVCAPLRAGKIYSARLGQAPRHSRVNPHSGTVHVNLGDSGWRVFPRHYFTPCNPANQSHFGGARG